MALTITNESFTPTATQDEAIRANPTINRQSTPTTEAPIPSKQSAPEKPLACYPGVHPKGVPDLSTKKCDSNIVMKEYLKLSKGEGSGKLPVIARSTGSIFDRKKTNPFLSLIPLLDKVGINDIRSTEVFVDMIHKDKDLLNTIKEWGELSILYPGGGSHIAPIALGLIAANKQMIKKASFLYTEKDKYAFNRISKYLSSMEKIGLIDNLGWNSKARKLTDKPNSSVSLSWTYKDIPMELKFIINASGKFWVSDKEIPSCNVTIFHDSIYQIHHKDIKDDLLTDSFIKHLRKLSQSDGKTRIAISEDQWKRFNDEDEDIGWETTLLPDSTCFIAGEKQRVSYYSGFYGHGLSYQTRQKEYIITQDGKLAPLKPPKGYKYPMVHLGGEEEGAFIIPILQKKTP